jgi:MoxR-like ATPase
MEIRKIDTSLMNKEETFKMIALAETTSLPLLIEGTKGTGKTKSVIEYAKAWLNKDGKMSVSDFENKIFILETGEGTKTSEIKGFVDLEKLFKENEYKLFTPITEAEVIIINEIDKTSEAIRNELLGVMNEKFLFTGKEKIPCKWKLFIGTCNEIPKDEKDSPFWDRFILKHHSSRLSAGEILTYFTKGGKNYKENIEICIPNKQDINNVKISPLKIEKFINHIYSYCSDRTLTFANTISASVKLIWDTSVNKALLKTAAILTDSIIASSLNDILISKEYLVILNKLDLLHSVDDITTLNTSVAEIRNTIKLLLKNKKIDEQDAIEAELIINEILTAKN